MGSILGPDANIMKRRRVRTSPRPRKSRSETVMEGTLGDLVYDISLRPFGSIERASGSVVGAAPESVVGKRCYEALYGRSAPCVGCPVRGANGAMRVGVTRTMPGQEGVTLV